MVYNLKYTLGIFPRAAVYRVNFILNFPLLLKHMNICNANITISQILDLFQRMNELCIFINMYHNLTSPRNLTEPIPNFGAIYSHCTKTQMNITGLSIF